jgi:hypothetical protein
LKETRMLTTMMPVHEKMIKKVLKRVVVGNDDMNLLDFQLIFKVFETLVMKFVHEKLVFRQLMANI